MIEMTELADKVRYIDNDKLVQYLEDLFGKQWSVTIADMINYNVKTILYVVRGRQMSELLHRRIADLIIAKKNNLPGDVRHDFNSFPEYVAYFEYVPK